MKRSASDETNMTASRFAAACGLDRHALVKALEDIEAKPIGKATGKGAAGASLYRLRDLHRAATGGDDAKLRREKLREERDKLAIANARSRGELVEVAAVKRLGQNVMAAVRNRILTMPLTDEEKDGCLAELLALKDMDWTR